MSKGVGSERRTNAAQEWVAKYPQVYRVIASRAQDIAERYHGILAKTHLLQALNEWLSGQGQLNPYFQVKARQEKPRFSPGCTCRVATELPDGSLVLGGIDDCPIHGIESI